jgi:hypothetical protein
MTKARTFWASFLDGLTGEGIFGDLRIPDFPDLFFMPEPESDTAEFGALPSSGDPTDLLNQK